MKSTIIAAVAATAVSSFAGPHFLDAGFVQDPTSHHVTISYTLDEPAVVSLDVLTNGVSIGRSAVDAMDDGTFHRKVEAGLHTLTWVPHKTWVQDVFSNNSVRVQVTAWPTNAPPDWMVVDLLHPGVVRWYASPEESPWGDFTNNVACKTDYLVLKRVPAGGRHFRMGNVSGATIFPTRNTPHIVHFSQDFYMAVFMLTQYQYDRLNEETPRAVTPTDALLRPTYNHTYDAVRGGNWPTSDAVGDNSFLKKMRDRYGIDFDLPTDAQWEYTCRAGTDTVYYNGCETNNLSATARSALGWFSEEVGNDVTPRPVGLKQPNSWGFFDFYGNKFEWCRDWYKETLDRAEVTDPRGPASASNRLARGGSTQHSVKSAPDYRCSGSTGGIVGIRLWAPAGLR